MDNIHVISLIQMLAGAVIIGITIFLCSKSWKQYMKKQQMNWMFMISLMLSGAYALLIILAIKRILSAEALSGGLALVCSCLIAVMAAVNSTVTKRLREEIAEHNISKDKINDLSLTDHPTGLYNRRGFISIIEKHLTRLKRLKKKAVLFYLELNNLHEINGKSGYTEGDKVLANVGTLMTAAFREADVIARIGDDEFIACLVDADSEDMEAVKNNFQNKLQTYNDKRSSQFKLSVSFTVSGFDPEINESALEMISKVSAPVKQKRKKQQSRRVARSENKNNKNFTLIVSNMSSISSPVDIQIYIDGELAIEDAFTTGVQNAWKPFHFKLAKGKHSIKAKSLNGRATIEQEFKMTRDHWASIEYHKDKGAGSVAQSVSGQLFFKLHDVPLEYRFVRPIKDGASV